jgi:D-lactate dehydrogenase
MKIAVFSTKPYDRRFLDEVNAELGHELTFLEPRLTSDTAPLAEGFPAVCAFVNDELGRPVLEALRAGGTELVALRCAGFNNVDLEAAEELGIEVVRVPAYSPYAVAEHTLALILALNRRIHRAYNRVREGNFNLDGLLGFDLRGKTAGVVGTGRIGEAVIRILAGIGCDILAHDPYPSEACEALGARFVPIETLLRESDIITLHCPLTPETFHLIDEAAIAVMKPGVMLVNTSRGEIVHTRAVIEGLKSGQIGNLALDVYEEEGDLFFRDLSGRVLADDVFARLLTFPNVIITGHQAFFTREAMENIARTTLENVRDIELHGHSDNAVRAAAVTAP